MKTKRQSDAAPPYRDAVYAAPFSSREYERRFRAVRAHMKRRETDALLVTSPENIYYLIGLSHQGYFAFTMLIFPLEGTPVLISREMERMTIAAQAPHVRHIPFSDGGRPATAVIRALRVLKMTTARIGVEKNTLFFPPRIWDEMQNRLPAIVWRDDAVGTVDLARFVKSSEEIKHVRRAAAITDAAVMRGMAVAAAGVNEKDIAAEIYHTMIKEGSEFPGFVPLIRSMETLRLEHVTWRDNILEDGDDLFMELSASIHRYHAPETRMLYISRAPKGARESAKIALHGLETVRANLNPGTVIGDVYDAWEREMRKALGDEDYRRHHCGYTVGIGFPPSWSGGSTVVGIRHGSRIRLKEGMVFHLLPWIFGTKRTDYAISDTVVITKNGSEFLTKTPRDLAVV